MRRKLKKMRGPKLLSMLSYTIKAPISRNMFALNNSINPIKKPFSSQRPSQIANSKILAPQASPKFRPSHLGQKHYPDRQQRHPNRKTIEIN